MEKIEININKYINLEIRYALDGEYGDYIERWYIYSILADKLHLKEEEIIPFLEGKKTASNTIKDKKKNKSKSEAFADNFMELLSQPPKFNPVTLEYFRKYIGNLKENTMNLIDLVDNIDNDDYQELFSELDIHIIDGKIHYEDVLRICKPIIYNVFRLREMEKKANDKETYLTFSVSKDYLGRDGLSLSDICPPVGYQFSPFEMPKQDGYIELTEKQKEKAFDKILSRAATICALVDVQDIPKDKRLGYINKNKN